MCARYRAQGALGQSRKAQLTQHWYSQSAGPCLQVTPHGRQYWVNMAHSAISLFFFPSLSLSLHLSTHSCLSFLLCSLALSLSLYMHSQIWVSWPDTGVLLKICFSKHSMFPRLARAVTPSTYLGCSQTLCWIKVKGFYNQMLAWRRNATGLFTQRSKKYRHPSRMMLIRSVWPVGSRDMELSFASMRRQIIKEQNLQPSRKLCSIWTLDCRNRS